MFNRSEN